MNEKLPIRVNDSENEKLAAVTRDLAPIFQSVPGGIGLLGLLPFVWRLFIARSRVSRCLEESTGLNSRALARASKTDHYYE